MNDTKILAACAVYKNLCLSEMDVYDALAEFIRQIFVNNNIKAISLNNLCDELHNEYGFNIPTTVAERIIGKIPELQIKKGDVTLKAGQLVETRDIRKDMYIEEQSLSALFDELVDFIQKDQYTGISKQERLNIERSFCDYLLDDKQPTIYSYSIYKFILENRLNDAFIKQCNRIKEGYIEYTGLTNNEVVEISNVLTSKLVIYLETEILFNAAGYNGDIYKRIFDEFMYYVNKINQYNQKKEKKDIIYLRYFDETKDEIDGYFKSAEDVILRKKNRLPNHHAMDFFYENCHSIDELIELRVKFDKLLKDLGIQQDTDAAFHSHDIPQNWQYAINRSEMTKGLVIGSDEYEKINKNLDLLEHIQIRRGNRVRTIFSGIGHILLTSNHKVHELARDSRLRGPKDIPLATHITFLTNRFWLACGGILTNDEFSSINVISRVQMILAAKLHDTTARLFSELKEKVKNGEFTSDMAAEMTAKLRLRGALVPDEMLTSDNFDDTVKYINETDLTSFITREKEDRDDLKRLRKQEQYYKELPIRIGLRVGLFLLWCICWGGLLLAFASGGYAIYAKISNITDKKTTWCCIMKSIECWEYAEVLSPCILLWKKFRRFCSTNLFRQRNIDALTEKIMERKRQKSKIQ